VQTRKIKLVHRPEMPASLLDRDLPVGHLDEQTTLSDLGMPDARQAAEHYREKFRRAAGQPMCRRLLGTIGLAQRSELDEIRRNIFTLRAHMHIKHDYGERVDWTTVIDGDIESNVAINHHWHIMQMALAYKRLNDEDCAAHAVELLRSWFEQSPAPADKAELQWRTLEVGGRLSLGWPVIGLCLHDYAGFTDRDLFDLIRWTWMSIRHLRKFAGPPNNWLQVESIGALCGLALLGPIPAAEGWAELFWKRLDWINAHHFLPDGMQSENSPGYHLFPWWRLYMGGVWIELFGGTLPEGYWQEQVVRARPLWMLRQPDGSLPMLSDCGPHLTRADKELDFVREHQPDADVPDVAALQKSETLPEAHRICHLPYAGYTVVRTGWREDDEFLLFDHGFYGTNHQHEDKLTFLYAAKGRLLIGDAGIYRYSRDAWEHYFRGACGHNVIRLDGKEQCRTLRARQGKYETIPDDDCRFTAAGDDRVVLSGWYREGFAERLHYLWDRTADRSDELATLDESIQWQRVLVWLGGQGVLVIDRLEGSGAHEVDQVFHLWPFSDPQRPAERIWPGTVRLAEPCACLLPEGNLPGALLVAGGPDMPWVDYCGSEDPLRGWTSLYGLQPSHDLWRSGRLELPAVLAVWIQPWTELEPPHRASLHVDGSGDVVEFDVAVGAAERIAGQVDLADLALRLQ